MLERTDAITNEVLEPITFVPAYPLYIFVTKIIHLELFRQAIAGYHMDDTSHGHALCGLNEELIYITLQAQVVTRVILEVEKFWATLAYSINSITTGA
jgi:hypothetical protein